MVSSSQPRLANPLHVGITSGHADPQRNEARTPEDNHHVGVRAMSNPDPRALQVARAVRLNQQPDLTILFGSRARGDHHEPSSDIDIMLVQEMKPTDQQARLASKKAEDVVEKVYGQYVTVQLVWRTREEFRHNRRYSNSVETNAAREGTIMPRNPENYSHYDYEDEETEYEVDWTTYDQSLRHAEIHLAGFINNCEQGLDDLLIGQQAQNSLEHAMKALLTAHGAPYRKTHNIGELLGNIRYRDVEMSDFRLSVPPDVYTAYEGDQEYRPRTQPPITEFPDYREQTTDAAQLIIDRARQVRAQSDAGEG